MEKNRLFIVGDSFTDWDIPNHHWVDYLSEHYDVYNFGKRASDNYSILFQLGNLPEYVDGDRVVAVFTYPGRLPQRFYGERKITQAANPYRRPNFFKDTRFAHQLDNIGLIEGNDWANGKRINDINFLIKLKEWMYRYNPIYVTWSPYFAKSTSEFVTLIETTSNYDEGIGEEMDFHPGPMGCYEWYKKIHSLLEIKEPIVEFKPHDIKKTII